MLRFNPFAAARGAAFALALALIPMGAALAQQAVDFKGKAVVMIIGYAPGGGTDASGRLIAEFLARHLPGAPDVRVQNMPGADGMTAMNHIAQKVAPDGLTLTMGASPQVDPLVYRVPQSQYDPSEFPMIGGVGRGGTALIMRADAFARLTDKSAPPVIVGSIGGVPRSGMQMVAWGIEFLGWNAKWVVGYRGTNDVILALERGEVDMTSTGNMFQLAKLVGTGKFRIPYQSGTLEDGKLVPRTELGDAALFPNQMEGTITDPLAQKAFAYWRAINAMDKWLALPPKTPDAVTEAYRAAYRKVAADPEFLAKGKRISEDFSPMLPQDVSFLMETLGNTPDEALGYMKSLLRKQGLKVE